MYLYLNNLLSLGMWCIRIIWTLPKNRLANYFKFHIISRYTLFLLLDISKCYLVILRWYFIYFRTSHICGIWRWNMALGVFICEIDYYTIVRVGYFGGRGQYNIRMSGNFLQLVKNKKGFLLFHSITAVYIV